MICVSAPIDDFEKKFARHWIMWNFLLVPVFAIFCNNSWWALFPFLLSILGAFIFWKTVWCVVEEVTIHEDRISFRRKLIECNIPFQDVLEFDHPFENFKGLIRVHYIKDGKEKKFTFRAVSSPISSFSETKIFINLKERLDKAKNNCM